MRTNQAATRRSECQPSSMQRQVVNFEAVRQTLGDIHWEGINGPPAGHDQMRPISIASVPDVDRQASMSRRGETAEFT